LELEFLLSDYAIRINLLAELRLPKSCAANPVKRAILAAVLLFAGVCGAAPQVKILASKSDLSPPGELEIDEKNYQPRSRAAKFLEAEES